MQATTKSLYSDATAAGKYVLLEPLRTPLYEGVVPVPTVPSTFHYLGPKMPLKLWQQVLHWFKTKSHGEVMIRFFVDFEKGEWHAIPFPQHYPTGLSVKEIEGHALTPDTGCLTQFGSAHHHCNAGAFPSHTDDQDEAKVEGLHLIVGGVDKEEMSVFLRLSVVLEGKLGANGQLLVPSRQAFIPEDMLDLTELFTDPAVDMLPVAIRKKVIRMYLTQYMGQEFYPPEWDQTLIKPEPVQVAQPWNNTQGLSTWGQPSFSWKSSAVTAEKKVESRKKPIKKNQQPLDYKNQQPLVDFDGYELESYGYMPYPLEKQRRLEEFYEALEDLQSSKKADSQRQFDDVVEYFYGSNLNPPEIVDTFSYFLTHEEMADVMDQFLEEHQLGGKSS